MSTTESLTIRQFQDMIAAPSLLLGFHPDDSCVVMAVRAGSARRKAVLFCLRVDLDWYAAYFDQVAEQLYNAQLRAGPCEWILIAYSASEDDAEVALEELSEVLGGERVAVRLICDGNRYWPVGCPHEAVEYDFDSSALAAQAVYQGVSIQRGRRATVAEVEAGVVDIGIWSDAVEEASAMSIDDKLARLRTLMEDAPDGEYAATRLAVLLQDEECFVAVLTELKTTNAERHFGMLTRARRSCPDEAAPNPLALLGLACWLAGRAAQHTACLEQLARVDPEHPMLRLLLRLHRLAIPPAHWDD